jgi:hypothetical protein
MLPRFKWRILLPLSNLLAALGQSALGLKKSEAFLKANPPHDQVLPYVPMIQVISYCINAPALVLSNLIDRIPVWRAFWNERWLGSYLFRDISGSFYVALALLWCWVGWRLDTRDRLSEHRRMVGILGHSLGILLSSGLIYIGVYLLRTSAHTLLFAGGSAIPTSVLIWGMALLFYFGKMLRHPKPHQKS